MKKIHYIFLLVTMMLLSSCSLMVMKKHLPQKNPMEYTYHFSFDSVKTVIDSLLLLDKYYSSAYKNHGIDKYQHQFWCIEDSPWGKAPCKSEMYYFPWGQRLHYYPNFCIQIDSLSDNETKVIFSCSCPRMKMGLILESEHFVPFFSRNVKNMPPSTIEEYRLLLKIGEILGEKNMPPLIKATVFRKKKKTSSSGTQAKTTN